MPKLSRLPFFNFRAHPNDIPYYQPARGRKESARINRVLHGLGDPEETKPRELGKCFDFIYLMIGQF